MNKHQKERIEARYEDLWWCLERADNEASAARYSGELAGIRYAVESAGYHFLNRKIVTRAQWEKALS